MEVRFDESFLKSVKNLADKKVKKRLFDLIANFESAESLSKIPNLKKMRGFQRFYRVRLGEYRVGFELLDDASALFILVAHRKDIYKYFP